MREQCLDWVRPVSANCIDLGANVALFEFDDSYRIIADLHGLTLRDISVAWNPGMLTVAGERRLAPSEDRDDVSDRFPGSFTYNIGLPGDADEEEVRGQFEEGVLMLTIGRL